MSAVTDAPVIITLAGGFTIQSSVAIWLIEASFRLTFSVVDQHLEVSPAKAITLEDDDFIRAHREHLFHAVRYIDRLRQEPI